MNMEEYPIKEDCFAFDKKRCECTALNDMYCKRGICTFYKTAAQHKKEKKKYPFDKFYIGKDAQMSKDAAIPADYITTSEATRLADISEHKVHKLIYNGTFSAIKIGSMWRISREDVARYAKENVKEPPKEIDPEMLYTPAAAARLLGIQDVTIHAQIRQGKIPYEPKENGHKLLRGSTLIQYRQEHEGGKSVGNYDREKYCKTEEAIKIIGKSSSYLIKAIHAGVIAAVKYNGIWLVERASLEAMMNTTDLSDCDELTKSQILENDARLREREAENE